MTSESCILVLTCITWAQRFEQTFSSLESKLLEYLSECINRQLKD